MRKKTEKKKDRMLVVKLATIPVLLAVLYMVLPKGSGSSSANEETAVEASLITQAGEGMKNLSKWPQRALERALICNLFPTLETEAGETSSVAIEGILSGNMEAGAQGVEGEPSGLPSMATGSASIREQPLKLLFSNGRKTIAIVGDREIHVGTSLDRDGVVTRIDTSGATLEKTPAQPVD